MSTEPSTELSAAEYRDLLSAALSETTDVDTLQPNVHTLFTPNSHRAALFVDSTADGASARTCRG